MKTLNAILILLALALPAAAGDLEITVYNSNIGLIKEIRELELQRGIHEFEFPGVPSSLIPETVHFVSLSDPEGTRVLEQNYRYDLLNRSSLLKRYKGKEVQALIDGEWRTVRLLAHGMPAGDDTPIGRILEVDGKIHIEGFILPELPEGLLLEPSLVWMLDTDRPGAHDVELSYLSHGLNWQADYVAVVDENNLIDLTGWVSLNNNSGRSYENARLKLVAGDLNRQRSNEVFLADMVMEASPRGAKGGGFEEETFFEYHLYTLQRPTTLLDRERKQVELLQQPGVAAERVYTYRSWATSDEQEPRSLEVTLEFANSEDKGLGLPLPKGTVRVYMEDESGQLQFAGEDGIRHTPEDEDVRLKVGEAFDLQGEHRVKRYDRNRALNYEERDIEIRLRNHKDEDVTVRVVEQLPGYREWTLRDASHKYEKTSASEMVFEVPVEAGGESVVTYTVRIK